MRRAALLTGLLAVGQLGFAPLIAAPVGETHFFAVVCGRPGPRIAIPLRSHRNPTDEDQCPGACHAALCRKNAVSAGARGARA